MLSLGLLHLVNQLVLLMMKLLVKNIGQLVTVVEGGEVCLAGKGMGQIKVGRRVLPIREINADIAWSF